jgi:hypothetical protein
MGGRYAPSVAKKSLSRISIEKEILAGLAAIKPPMHGD